MASSQNHQLIKLDLRRDSASCKITGSRKLQVDAGSGIKIESIQLGILKKELISVNKNKLKLENSDKIFFTPPVILDDFLEFPINNTSNTLTTGKFFNSVQLKITSIRLHSFRKAVIRDDKNICKSQQHKQHEIPNQSTEFLN